MSQFYTYTDEIIQRLNAYARNIPPTVQSSYIHVHPAVRVPPGHLPIKIVQYRTTGPAPWYPHHWSIFVPTSIFPHIGHYYQPRGHLPVLRSTRTIGDYNHGWHGEERGSHTFGYVLPAMLPVLESRVALVGVGEATEAWHSQRWVWDALQGLNEPHMCVVRLSYEMMAIQMGIVGAVWEREREWANLK